ncbi:MAG TPA: hypothetical protein VMB50_02050 [Myxococcales bacterium]|nr:hypothetical protein [Myxococcales bacterium]
MRRALGWVAVPLGLGLAACFSSPDQQQVQTTAGCSTSTCTKATTGRTTRSGNGSSSGGAGGSSTGGGTGGSTTGGGTSGGNAGNTGGQVCGTPVTCTGDPSSLDACLGTPPCAGAMCAQVCDEFAQTGVCGATVEAIDSNGLPIAGTSQTTQVDGSFLLCPPSQTFTVATMAAGYQTTYSGQIDGKGGNTASYYYVYGNEVPVFSHDDYLALASAFGNGVTSNSSIVAVSIDEPSCGIPSGFTLSVVLPDGGLLPDGGPLPYSVEYVSDGIPNAGLTETDDGGNGFLLLDPAQTSGFVSVVATPVNLAPGCQSGSTDYAAAGMTGLVYVAPGSFTATQVPVSQ